jgi:hypothetical protein
MVEPKQKIVANMFTANRIHNGQFWTMFSHKLQRQLAQKVDEILSLEYVKALLGQPITELCREKHIHSTI